MVAALCCSRCADWGTWSILAASWGSATQENQDTLNLSLQHNPHNESAHGPLHTLLPCRCVDRSRCVDLPVREVTEAFAGTRVDKC